MIVFVRLLSYVYVLYLPFAPKRRILTLLQTELPDQGLLC